MGQEMNVEFTREGNTSFIKTVFNGLNTIIGIGLLSVPYALASGGWLSLVLLLAIASAACYGGLLTGRCMEANPSIRTYSDMGELAFGKLGNRMISVILFLDIYLVLTGFLILEGDNLHSLFPEMRIKSHNVEIGGKQCFVVMIALVLLPTVWLEDLSILAYFSATGVVSSLLILASVLCLGVFGGIGFHNKGDLLNWKGIPEAMSLYVFSYSANPVFPTLYDSMQTKHHFSKVLLLGFVSATMCYTSMAILGYMMFGSSLKSQVTLNLPTDKFISKIAIYTTWITPLSRYALMLEPIAASIEFWFPNSYVKKRLFKILLRTALVATQVIVALSVPFFGSLMSLVGALLSGTASITIPCLCYWKISKANPRMRSSSSQVERAIIILLILLSVLVVIIGTYTSLSTLMKETTRHYS